MSRSATIVAAIFIMAPCAAQAQAKPSVREQLEQMATELVYFSPDEFVFGRTAPVVPDRGRVAKDLPVISNQRAAQRVFERSRRIVRELSSHEWKSPELKSLLDHPNAKVRTLAAAALFATDDSQNIPPLAKLIADGAPTFPSSSIHHLEMSGIGGSCLQPQTVQQVVRAFIRPYISTSIWEFSPARPNADPQSQFDSGWQARHGRTVTCRDFQVWQNRATGDDIPGNALSKRRFARILDRLRQIPLPDRAWYAMALVSPTSEALGLPHNYLRGNQIRLLSDEATLELARRIDHERLLRALRRDIDTTDPTLTPGGLGANRSSPFESSCFNNVREFILAHASLLLRPEDAEQLMAIARREGGYEDGWTTASWALAAAVLQEDRAIEILRGGLDTVGEPVAVGKAGTLMTALWKRGGRSQANFIVDWCYSQFLDQKPSRGQLEQFLKDIGQSTKPDGRQLISQIVADNRLSHIDWVNTKTLVGIVNGRLADPWCNEDELDGLGGGYPMSIADSFLLDREKSRREYPEEFRLVEETIAFWQSQLRERIDDYCAPEPK